MALKTKIIVQQAISVDPDNIIVGKYPRYTIHMGTSISSITATELATAVDLAQTAATEAKESEVNSKTSETNSKASELAAKTSEDNSKASEIASKTSEDNSKASELAAKASEDAAKISETNAAESKRLAELARQGAETAEDNSKASEIASKTSEDNSKASELAAKASEDAAKISETNAGNSETSAETDATRAEAAADRAEAVLDSKLDKEDISVFFKGYQTKAQADADVGSRVPGEKILVWNQEGPKYSWYVVKDTAGVLSLELESDELKMVSVNNIRPDSLGNVQVTIPGGNPSLWLGEVTWFPYDKDNNIGYSGILLADGREVRRVDYPDTWVAIETGLIPSVTEAEWQAGQNMYFSTGDGSTTFRLPNLLQGQAFRAASIGEEDTSKIQEQIPFITTVNGVGPVDATGAVVIGITNLEGTLPIDQGGTGATTAIVAKSNLGLSGFNQTATAISMRVGTFIFQMDNAGVWGVTQTGVSGWKPLAIAQGGTGAQDAATARTNLALDRITQTASETQIHSPSKNTFLTVKDGTGWGVYSNDAGVGWVALGLAQGGTGAKNASDARTNLQVDRLTQSAGSTTLTSPSKAATLTIQDSLWGVYKTGTNETIPLGIYQGGTGATTVTEAKENLGLGTYASGGSQTIVQAPAKIKYLFVSDSGNSWGCYSNAPGVGAVALPIENGGTGSKSAVDARYNLGLSNYSQDSTQAIITSTDKGTKLYIADSGLWGVNKTGVSGWILPNGITVDSNGFLKRASPIVKIWGDGSSELNEEAVGVVTERIDTGIYRISGILGFNSDPAWGGIDGGFSIPENSNKLPLLWVDFMVEESGDILLKTYHREHKNVPSFASNFKEGIADGDPTDIPEGRWVDLRVEMPFSEEPEFPEVLPESLEEALVVEE